MADFVEKVRFYFMRQNKQRTQFEDALMNCVKETASASAALANAAMIISQGCPKRYVEAIITLYTANQLPCPDLSMLFDQNVSETPESECHSAPKESQDPSIQSIFRHIEDVDELPASMDEVIDILADFDTFEGSSHLFVNSDSLLKTGDHKVPFNTVQSVDNDSLSRTNEQGMLDDWLDEETSVQYLPLPIADDSVVSFEMSHFPSTFSDPFPNSSMISPITTKRMTTFSAQADSLRQLKMSTPGKTKHSAFKCFDFSPIKRELSSPIPTAKSTSTFSLATSMPASVRKSFNMGTTKSTPGCVRKSSTNYRSQSSLVDDEESFVIISLKETPTGLEKVNNSLIRNPKPYIKSSWLMNYNV